MKTIFVVDDEIGIVDTLRDILKDEGFEVVTARNGHNAMKLLQDVKPHLLILDLMMPVLSGYTLLEVLQADPALDNIPVIIISAVPKKVAFSAGLPRIHLVGYLRKPFTLEALLHAIFASLDSPS